MNASAFSFPQVKLVVVLDNKKETVEITTVSFLLLSFYSSRPESCLSIASAAVLPAPIAEITVAAPVTTSPPA